MQFQETEAPDEDAHRVICVFLSICAVEIIDKPAKNMRRANKEDLSSAKPDAS